jgi:6-phospho-beta-glucosidase
MKLAVLGGGGARMPAFVRAVLVGGPALAGGELFSEISLWEPDQLRRDTTCRLSVELAGVLGKPGAVQLAESAEEAFDGADFVFSAVRVGGDQGRVIDEQVALKRGLVGQETTGPGGAMMALRTIPVVLSYCEALKRAAPSAVLINFTNPAGIITQALCLHGGVPAVGVCDTPGSALEKLAEFLGVSLREVSWLYAGLNHLGWVTSFRVAGEERLAELLFRYEELQHFDHRFAAFDAGLVRQVGAIPTEYVYYYYDPHRYVEGVRRAGSSRGQDVLRLNEELLAGLGRAFDRGGVKEAWSEYSMVLGVRRDTYMRTDTEGASGQASARALRQAEGPELLEEAKVGGYEGVALKVIAGLTARQPAQVIVNTINGTAVGFLGPDDVVEVPSYIHGGGIQPLAAGELPRSARGLVTQMKEYERMLVDAAVNADAGMAVRALALHPLVPGLSAAEELFSEYRELHGPYLAYLR